MKYNLGICTLFRNEAKHLKEWIEYHQLVGVDHFYLYNNGSSDRYLSVLRPYIKRDVVTLVQWPDQMAFQNRDSDEMWALSTQIPAYENAARYKAINETKWLAFVGIDEFLVPQKGEKITDILERYDDQPAVRLVDEFYDASNVRPKVPPRRLLIETVELTRDPEGPKEKKIVKTIFKPKEIEYFSWSPFEYTFKGERKAIVLDRSEGHVNHYLHRNVGYQGRVKPRAEVNGKIAERDKRELLEQEYELDDQERAIYRYIPEVSKRMGLDPYVPGMEMDDRAR